MAEPVNPILIWAEQDVTLPGLDGANKTLPLVELSDIGWDKGQKPAADEINYLLNNYGEWLQWHEDSKAPLTDFANSLTTNGYQNLSGGLILQWGSFNTGPLGNNATGSQSFPIAFPSSCLQVIIGSTSGTISGTPSSEGLFVTSFNLTSFSWTSAWEARSDANGQIRWMSLGY